MPMRITIGVNPNKPTRCLGGAGVPGAPPALSPVCDPGGGRNSSVSGNTDCFGTTLVPAADESGPADVESGRAPEIESAGAESGRAVAAESGEAAVESGPTGCSPGAGAALTPVEARACVPLDTPHAAATTNAKRK